VAMGLARRGMARATGRTMAEPLSGQRAVRWEALPALLPFAPGFGVEVAMTIDALRAGLRVVEIEVDLRHNATGKDLAGLLHRARQARAISRELTRRRAWRPTPNGTTVPVDAGVQSSAGGPDPEGGRGGQTPADAGSPNREGSRGGGGEGGGFPQVPPDPQGPGRPSEGGG
jgi:hypothetical protein